MGNANYRNLILAAALALCTGNLPAQVLNMSHDLVALGIAGQNLAPNNPALDSRPLFQAAINYLQSHPVQTLTLDTGAYYLLTNTQSNAVLLFPQLNNLTVDLAGSTLYFSGPLVPNGFAIYYCSNVTLANFQIDYVHPPYTHVQLTSVDTINRILKYQTLAGWPDPATFNSLTSPFGGPIQGYWAAIFRNGSIVPGTTRMLLQAPFTNNGIAIQDQSPWAQASTLSTLEAGDTVVVYARGGGPIMWVFYGNGLTFSNIAIYGAQGIQLLSTTNSTMRNMRFAPRPGSGLVGGVGGIAFLPPGPNNHILNSYVARTLDDALVFEDSGPATVVSQSGSRQLTVSNQGYRFPNGTAMNFVDPGTTLESAGGVIVDQNPPDNPNPVPGNVTVTFDRDLPTIAPGTFMVFGSAATRGQGSTVEDTLIEDTYGGHGILLQGVEGVTVQRNVVRRTSMAGIHVDQSADAAVDSADLNPPSHDVIITDNALEATLGPAPCGTGMQFCLGGIEIVSTNNQDFGFASSPANTNITVHNNYIADSARSGIWIGELNGGTLQNNLVIRYSQNPTLGGTAGIPAQFTNQVMQDALLPVVIHYSTAVAEVGDTISATSPVTAPVSMTPPNAIWPAAGGAGSFNLQTAVTGFGWNATSDSPWLAVTTPLPGAGSGTVQYAVAANNTGASRTGNITIAGVTFPVLQNTVTTASLSVSRTRLNFGVSGSTVTDPQIVAVLFTGGIGGGWTAASNQANISVSPASGTGSGTFLVTATAGPSGIVTVASPGATNSPQQIQVNLVNAPAAAPPYGSFDTPLDNTTGIAGAIPVTGWALDNVGVASVGIYREPIGSEHPGPNGLLYVGNATFVSGARPDVETRYPTTPLSYRAGWGYMLLTNFLPNSNGTYKLHAIATNKAGATTDLGTRTITVDNAHASKPFGTIDTPDQGATASGNAYINFGWALTQNPYCIPADGSTITVFIDGVPVGHPAYGQRRNDIVSLFPGLCNTNNGVGFFYIDTTTLANGVHTIFWTVSDNASRSDGIGSRYFTVQNSGTGPVAAPEDIAPRPTAQNVPETIEIEEVSRIEFPVGATSGYLSVQGERRPLPIGSTLKGGVFYWQPGPGFLGAFDLVFERPQREPARVRIVVKPKSHIQHRENFKPFEENR